jgi:alkaline phosphatase D
MGLDDFRHLHRTYRSDEFLRAALARHTLIATWDDHEIVNNRYWDYDADRPATPSHPRNDDPAFLVDLFAEGIKAWWEYVPSRVHYDPKAEHLHERLRLWRSFRFGDLLDLFVTDERLFRSEPGGGYGGSGPAAFTPDDARRDPDRTMLGDAQRRWFFDGVERSDATWTAWGNEVLNMAFRLDLGDSTFENPDAWDGFEAERREFMRLLRDRSGSNFVALTGDMHTALAGYLQMDYPQDDETAAREEKLGVEFMTPAVTSANLREVLDLPTGPIAEAAFAETANEPNPHLRFFDSHHWGYAVVEFATDACTYTAYSVDKRVDSADAAKRRLARLRVPAGRVEIRDAG